VQGELAEIPADCTIKSYRIIASPTGSIVFDIQKTTYAGYPTGLSSIVAANPPTLSGNVKAEDATLSGWNTALLSGDVVRWSISSVSGLTRAAIVLLVMKN
jgi:hypothetical protein